MKPLTHPVAMPVSKDKDVNRSARIADFEALYDAHAEFLWRTIRGLGASAADAEDLTHDVFLVAYRKSGAFEGRSSVRTWLCGIAVGLVRNHSRKNLRRQPDAPSSPAAVSGSERSEAADLVSRCLQDLDEQQRLLIVLADLEQMTALEIAEVLGHNINTIYARLRVAREAFEASLLRHRGAQP